MSKPARPMSSAARALAGLCLALLLGAGGPPPALVPAAFAQTEVAQTEVGQAEPDAAVSPGSAPARSGLPLPRFVSLGAAKVNLRTGPGGSYPIEWVYLRRHMPVEVIAEFDNWRRVRDWQGTEGWVHQNLLSGARYARIADVERVLLSRPDDGTPVARLMPGTIARILSCPSDWCEVTAGGYRGWLPRDGFWGVYPNETFN